MPIVKSMIRNSSSQKVLYFISLFSVICFSLLIFNRGIFSQVLVKDGTSLFLLCFGIISVIIIGSVTRLLLLFSFEYLSGQNSSIWKQLKNHLAADDFLCVFILYIVCIGFLFLDSELKLQGNYLLVVWSTSMLFACMTVLVDYDDVDLSSSQNMEKSIGASWAQGAYAAFYKKILIDLTQRMSEFEEKENIIFLVKKLVIICPLSCNANGSLEGKDGDMESIGTLREIVDDDGAATRKLKTNVYKIRGLSEAFIAAEIPSPLATLYEMRDVMDAVILEYHRKCFIQTLKNLTRSENCIILEYDDLNSPEPLHRFLLSKLAG